jgi:hypothetical protein
MSKGIKIQKAKTTLAVFLGLLIVGFALYSYAQENSSSGKNVFLDSDQDGLSDAEEQVYSTDPHNPDTDGDGYSDGAEIASGYNPLIPAPNDKILTPKTTQNNSLTSNTTDSTEDNASSTITAPGDDQNKTNELSQQVTNLIQTKSASNQNINVDDLDNIVNQLTSSSSNINFEDLPAIDKKTIKIKEQNYSKNEKAEKEKQDVEQYLIAVSYIMTINSPYKITSLDDINKFSQEVLSQAAIFSNNSSSTSYFENLADKGSDALKQLNDVEVPEDMVDLHIKGLQLMTYAVSLKDKYKVDKSDPVSSIFALSEVKNLMSLGRDYILDAQKEISNYGITDLSLNFLQ